MYNDTHPFPNSKRSLCTKHLKDNITDYLKNKIGIHLIDLIYGEQCILNSADTFQFQERCSQLLTNANTPDFNNYFERTLKPKLELNYKNLGREGLNAANKWTNNNAESINNIMKLEATQHTSTDKSFGRHYQTPATGPPACAVQQ
jgi:hypothetical protein